MHIDSIICQVSQKAETLDYRYFDITLVSFFSEDNVSSDKIKMMLYFRMSKERKSTVPLLGEHPVYL